MELEDCSAMKEGVDE